MFTRFNWKSVDSSIQRAVYLYPPARPLLYVIQSVRQFWHCWLERLATSDRRDLRNYEKKVYSQNGEDGIIEEIFRRIGATNKYFVEIGIQSGIECCSRNLLQNHGWRGVWIDADIECCAMARTTFASLPITITNSLITRDNIRSVLCVANVPEEFDLLIIDIDGNDYWVWDAITDYQPRLVCIEYNGTWGADKRWVMPYNENYRWDGSCYFGASLRSLAELGRQKGYSLVGCDSIGANAFFAKNDLINSNFARPKDPVATFFSSPKYQRYFNGHPPFSMSPYSRSTANCPGSE